MEEEGNKRKTGSDHGRKDREEEDWVRSREEAQRRGRLGLFNGSKRIQTHERFKKRLFIRIKHNK